MFVGMINSIYLYAVSRARIVCLTEDAKYHELTAFYASPWT